MDSPSTPNSGMHVHAGGSGAPALVFVHGFACDATDWARQVEVLGERTTVVACDLPSHGRSGPLEEPGSIRAFGAAVTRLIDELGFEDVVLVGHSMGCRVVLESARSAGDRVVGVVLVDGSRIGAGDPAPPAAAMATRLRGDGYRVFMRRFFEGMFVPTSDPTLRSAVVDRALRMPGQVGRPVLVDIVRWDAADAEAALDELRVPVLAVQTTTMDEQQERVPLPPDGQSAWIELLRGHVADLRIATISDAGHFPHIEDADEVTALIAAFHDELARGSRATQLS
jgi:pimeloyl-ACP methyl ester carboxylesterase